MLVPRRPGFGPGFGPGGPRRANRGDVRAAILSLLAEAPSNGYGLIKTIAEKTSGARRPSHQDELGNAWNTDAEGTGPAFHQSVGKLMGVIHQFRVAARDEQLLAAVEKIDDEARRALYLILAE
ncbi:hypothetical protein JOE40_000967 [Arthrobacter sp. PvP102]|nr:hypothetical protein [Arthrobacter sp. PvP103]MBP1236458.1 hypothetical protein [Arthrobacter sp. PvP102]